jgi:hypothetical protein
MSEIIVSMSGLGQFSLRLDLVDAPLPGDPDQSEVWKALFDDGSGDAWTVFFEVGPDYEVWDLIDEAIQVFRSESLPDDLGL